MYLFFCPSREIKLYGKQKIVHPINTSQKRTIVFVYSS